MNLDLLLTGRCNLSCRYCFQNDRRSGRRMKTETALSALEVVLGAGAPPHRVALSGGEPFLYPSLVRQVIRAVRRHPDSARISCEVFTNGTLVGEGDLAFLAESDTGLQVSFDGVASAQAQRRPGTRSALLGLLDTALEGRTDWVTDRLSVAIVTQSATVSVLAESVEELLSRGIRDIQITPLMTHDPGWDAAARSTLEEQIDRIVGFSRELWVKTRTLPVRFLNLAPRLLSTFLPAKRGPCGAATASSVAVDPDGQAWSCTSFIPSIQRLPRLGIRASRQLELGSVLVPGFARRLSELPRRARQVRLLDGQHRKRSWRGACRDCRFFTECSVCPVTTAHIPGNSDPHRVPDHQCDFQFATLAARRRFLSDRPALAWLSPGPARGSEDDRTRVS